MTEEREHNIYYHVCFASIASAISLILSIVVMLRYNYRKNLEIDYLGAIAGVLSLFVAVFVGVQIYQSFNLKRDIDEQNKKLLDNMKIENEKSLAQLKKEYQALKAEYLKIKNEAIRVPLTIALSQIGYSYYMLTKNTSNKREKEIFISNAIPILMNSISAFDNGLDNPEAKDFYNSSVETLEKIANMVHKGIFPYIRVKKDEYATYRMIADKSNDKRVKDFVNFLEVK